MATLSREDWAEINYLEAQIHEIFVRSQLMKKQILIIGIGFDIPLACFPGEDGYIDIQNLKAQIRAIKGMKHVPSIQSKVDSQQDRALSPDQGGGYDGRSENHVRGTQQQTLCI